LTVFIAEKFLYDGLLLDDPLNRTEITLFNLSDVTTKDDFQWYFGYCFNTWINLGYCPECIDAASYGYFPENRQKYYKNSEGSQITTGDYIYHTEGGWMALYFICTSLLLIAGVISVLLESMTVAPDVLGYVSSLARNSRYLHLPKTSSAMSGGERARKLGEFEVMMQDVKANAEVGRIALGLKHDGAQKLKPDRVYR
jgi:hypothetical protein